MQDISWDIYQYGQRISDGWDWLKEACKGAEKKGMDVYCGKRIAG